MRCADVMKTEFHRMHEGQSVQSAAQLMREHNVGFVPVCDARERIVGTLTDRDIAVRVCAEDWQASTCPVRDVMSSGVIACSPDDDIAVAAAMMSKFSKAFVVVVNEDDEISGILSLSEMPEMRPPAAAQPSARHAVARDLSSRTATRRESRPN